MEVEKKKVQRERDDVSDMIYINKTTCFCDENLNLVSQQEEINYS